jgi:putative Ca2+/H+ antiporter (TMEM165/GDT1 family)
MTFFVIALAEFGDKSQLVCMTLASKHKPVPVLLGATFAFLILNALAVLLGSSITLLIPINTVKMAASILFVGFGIHSVWSYKKEEGEMDVSASRLNSNVFITTFMMILLAELGDKTQLAVATLSTSESPIGVFWGSSMALFTTSLIGIWFGAKVLHRVNPAIIAWGSGVLFVVVGLLIGAQALMV